MTTPLLLHVMLRGRKRRRVARSATTATSATRAKCATLCATTGASTAPSARKTVSNLDIAAKCAKWLAFPRLAHASDVDANERQIIETLGRAKQYYRTNLDNVEN